MKRTTGIVLIIAALFLGYVGINKLDDSGKTVDFFGIRITAEDEEAKETGYIFIGLAALLLIGGVLSMRER